MAGSESPRDGAPTPPDSPCGSSAVLQTCGISESEEEEEEDVEEEEKEEKEWS